MMRTMSTQFQIFYKEMITLMNWNKSRILNQINKTIKSRSTAEQDQISALKKSFNLALETSQQ
jgi:hypothetical protein